MQYSEEQVSRAKSTDLVLFLQSQGEKLIKSGKEYRWMAHDSVTVRGNCWFRHSRGTGGGPIDFVMEFYGLTFPEAMKKLTGEEGEERRVAKDAPKQGIPLRIILKFTSLLTFIRILLFPCFQFLPPFFAGI